MKKDKGTVIFRISVTSGGRSRTWLKKGPACTVFIAFFFFFKLLHTCPDSSVRGCSEALLNQMREQKEFIAGLQLIIGEQRGLSAGDAMKPYRWGQVGPQASRNAPLTGTWPGDSLWSTGSALWPGAGKPGIGLQRSASSCRRWDRTSPRTRGLTEVLREPESLSQQIFSEWIQLKEASRLTWEIFLLLPLRWAQIG